MPGTWILMVSAKPTLESFPINVNGRSMEGSQEDNFRTDCMRYVSALLHAIMEEAEELEDGGFGKRSLPDAVACGVVLRNNVWAFGLATAITQESSHFELKHRSLECAYLWEPTVLSVYFI